MVCNPPDLHEFLMSIIGGLLISFIIMKYTVYKRLKHSGKFYKIFNIILFIIIVIVFYMAISAMINPCTDKVIEITIKPNNL